MNYHTIGFMLTNQCNARCKICCIGAGPLMRLHAKEIIKFLNGIGRDKRIRHIALSGGEILLPQFREDVFELLSFISRIGKSTSVITNAYWGEEISEAKEIMIALKKTGLNAMTISYDAFHQTFVSLNSIVNVCNLCKELDIQVDVQAVILDKCYSFDSIDTLNRLTGGISINFSACYPVGYAKDYFEQRCFIRVHNSSELYCRKSGAFSVNYDGNIWPCCSPLVTTTSLSVGNIHDGIDYKIALDLLAKNTILRNIRRYGFDYYIPNEKKMDITIPDKVISSCEVCSLLFG